MKHNILLIQVDQMHARALSVLGSPNVATPHLDYLASEGTLFRHAVCNNPICMPSRVSMLSGQYPSTTKQFGFSGLCDRRMPWLPRRLNEAGYRTGAFGKFHTACVGSEQWGMDVAAPTAGEDEDLARPPGNHYRAYCAEHDVPWPTDQIHCHNPFGKPAPLPPTATEAMHWARQKSCKSTVPVEHSLETYTTDRCIDFVRAAHKTEQPFFAWLTYDRPHSPTTLPDPWFRQLDPDAIELPPLPSWEEMQKLPPSYFMPMFNHGGIASIGREDFRFVLASYFKLIEWIDAEIGRVMVALEGLGIAAETTVVFTSDHGDEAGNQGLYDKSRLVSSDALTRVPLIVRPAHDLLVAGRGQVVDEPVELVDVAPTLCALADVEPDAGFEGRDLSAAILDGTALDAGRAVVCEDYWKRMITCDGWQLIFDGSHEREQQLYDMTTDPGCCRDRYADPDCQAVRIDLKRRLFAFLQQRLHGPYDETDVERIERGLDPGDDRLPLLTCGGEDAIQCFRSAAVVSDDKHLLLVRYDNPELLLFEGVRTYYFTRDMAVAMDFDLAESLLDRALRDTYASIQPLSLWVNKRVHRWLAPPDPPDPDDLRTKFAEAGVVV